MISSARAGLRGEVATGDRSRATRDPDERRAYAGDPWAYFAEVFGWKLTPQQDRALELIEQFDRVLVPAANNVGKTWLLSGYGIYRLDAVAALPDEDRGLDEQGAKILLPGPDQKAIFGTIYAEMLVHAARAEALGHLMPGERSDRSVLWHVRQRWDVEAFSPPSRVGQNVAHTASGRHHRNQVALIEEGAGVRESLWRAAEGMCSSEGNKIISAFNPTEPTGPAFQRATGGAYKVLHLDAFDHPNVRERRPVFPDAVGFRVVDERVRKECQDRGPASATPLDEERGDFVYALPPSLDSEELGPREDGVPGHPNGTVRVYRPSPSFTAQVRGRWPTTSEHSLFDPGAWDAAVARWEESHDPEAAPDQVGVDVAREGGDDTVAAPLWGEAAATLLQAYVDAQDAGHERVEELKASRRARIGELVVVAPGDGVSVAQALDLRFPLSPFNVDEVGVGGSPLDHLRRVLGRQVAGFSGAAVGSPQVAGTPLCENLRTSAYVFAARMVKLGLVDVPSDPLLREEVLAHLVEHKSRTVEEGFRKVRKPSVLLVSKSEVKKTLGRSPDRADAFVIALWAPEKSSPAKVVRVM